MADLAGLTRRKTWFDFCNEIKDMIFEEYFVGKRMMLSRRLRKRFKTSDSGRVDPMGIMLVSRHFATKEQVVNVMLRSAQILIKDKDNLQKLAAGLSVTQRSQVQRCEIRGGENEWLYYGVNELSEKMKKRLITPQQLRDVFPSVYEVHLVNDSPHVRVLCHVEHPALFQWFQRTNVFAASKEQQPIITIDESSGLTMDELRHVEQSMLLPIGLIRDSETYVEQFLVSSRHMGFDCVVPFLLYMWEADRHRCAVSKQHVPDEIADANVAGRNAHHERHERASKILHF